MMHKIRRYLPFLIFITGCSPQPVMDRYLLEATATSVAMDIQVRATQQALDLDRARMTNQVQALTPWVMLFTLWMLLLIAATIYMTITLRRPVIIPRDDRGDAPLILTSKGVYYDADRNPGAWMIDGKNPQMSPTSQAQIEVTLHDQMIDMSSRGLPSQGRCRSANKENLSSNLPAFQVFGENDIPPQLPEGAEDILNGVWTEVQSDTTLA